jgi:tRNA-Thr(GGU) m(6)t(6)A37 methyltransferase TsaA
MQTRKVTYRPIGIIHSPLKDIQGAPIQPAAAGKIRGTVEIKNEYLAGIKDLDGFSHIILIYHLHLVVKRSLEVVPFLDKEPHGVFATRAPARPNPIGLSVVKLLRIKGNKLVVENIDIIDGTPLLDIKPYVKQFDSVQKSRVGWLTNSAHKLVARKSDARFK